MSDYNFYGANTPASANTGVCTFNSSTGVISTTNNIASEGDMVYFKISDSQGAVGVSLENTRQFRVDTNIYANIPSSFTPSLAYKFEDSADLLHSDVRSFQMETSVSISTYSESYRPYEKSFDYTIIVDNKNRLFNGDVKTLISTNFVVFKDGCNNFAYLVSFGDDTFTTLNNKFKSSMTFNVATR